MNDNASSRADLAGALSASGLVLVFIGLLLWRNPELFWKDDYQISILPVFADVARSWNEGQWPLLSPYSWACGNLAGEFQYGTFSLFVNLAVICIWRFPLGFAQQAAALSTLHLLVLGAGCFLLARGRSLSRPLALLVALAGTLNGWIICWSASDWFGSLGAFVWLPWAWWAMERALDPARSLWRFLWPAPFVYLLVTGGFPYTVGMLLLVAAWLVAKSFGEGRTLAALWPLALGIGLGFGMAAPAWLALLAYLHGSTRAQLLGPGLHWEWTLPWLALPGFFYPGWTARWVDFSGNLVARPAIELACGLVPPVALLAGCFARFGEFVRQEKWQLSLFGLTLLLAILPSPGIFRWSFRWLPLIHLLLALLAAEAITVFRFRRSAHWLFCGVVFAVLLGTYWRTPTDNGLPRYPFSSNLTTTQPLDPARLYFSVYPPPEFFARIENHPAPVGELTRLGSTSMWAGLRFLNGYSPVGGAGVSRLFGLQIHGEPDLAISAQMIATEAGPDQLLALLGIDGIVLARDSGVAPPRADEWELALAASEGEVFHRKGAPLPVIRAVESLSDVPDEKWTAAQVNRVQDHRLRMEAEIKVPPGETPACLLVSRPFFPGYRAELESTRLEVSNYRGLIPMIKVPAGSHGHLTISYRPGWLLWSGAIAIVCALGWLGAGVCAIRRRAYQ